MPFIIEECLCASIYVVITFKRTDLESYTNGLTCLLLFKISALGNWATHQTKEVEELLELHWASQRRGLEGVYQQKYLLLL